MLVEWQNGIDTIAHKTTLECMGNTIAVLGSGFKNIFPKENIDLYYEIIKNGGLVISEYPPDIKAESEYFIARNRIVSGISMGVLIVEAMYRSGTSVTARFATEQNKKVFVLPHEIHDIHGVGTNKLIRKGAILVTSTKEIIDEFNFLEYRKVLKKCKKGPKRINKEDQKKKIETELKDEQYKHIYNIISTEITSMNEIYMKSKMQSSEINKILFFLEVEGYIEKVAGGYKCILNKG